jgi:hypothetical protein
MKKGKTAKISGIRSAKMVYGTVDSLELKSLYLNIQTWVEPKTEEENWNRVVLNMSRSIKHSVLETLDTKLFKDNFIVDVDLRSSGINLGKKSFMNIEINLYLIEPIDFKSKVIKSSLKLIVNGIYKNIITKNNFFKFYLTKKGNIVKPKEKTEKY